MTPDEAARRLRFHCEIQEGSLVGMLFPYRGLEEGVFVDVMHALRASAPLLRSRSVERDLVASLWTISSLARSCAHGQRNRKRAENVPDDDRAVLARFVERFDAAVFLLLEDGHAELGW